MSRIDVDLNLDLIAPAATELQLLPRLLDVDLENVVVGFADADDMYGEHLPEDRDQEGVGEGDGW